MRVVGLFVLLLLVACSTPVAVTPAAISTATPTPTSTPTPTPTPTGIWQGKLSGLWEQQTDTGVSEWLIDVAGGTIASRTFGGESKIEVEREEGQTVYILLRGQAGDRHDSFRFVGDDVVIWTQGQEADAREITLERK